VIQHAVHLRWFWLGFLYIVTTYNHHSIYELGKLITVAMLLISFHVYGELKSSDPDMTVVYKYLLPHGVLALGPIL
jgi:hypothetical protein